MLVSFSVRRIFFAPFIDQKLGARPERVGSDAVLRVFAMAMAAQMRMHARHQDSEANGLVM